MIYYTNLYAFEVHKEVSHMSLEIENRPLLVLLGGFNTQIMRDASWVKHFLFPLVKQDEITVNMGISLLNDEISSSMTIDDIRVDVGPGKIQITPSDLSLSKLDAIVDLIKNMASALPHTPLSAYGINFRFIEKLDKAVLKENSLLSMLFHNIPIPDSIKLEQQIKYDKSLMTFSLTENYDNGMPTLSYDFNFHFAIKSGELASMTLLKESIMDGDIEKYQTKAKSIA